MCTFYISKNKFRNVFIKKDKHFTKKKYNLRYDFIYQMFNTFCYAIFRGNFEIGISIQKALHFSLRDVLIYKKPDTLFYVSLYIKILTHCAMQFFMDF